jgi:5'-nucleotidase / UDP-sugar diphosphatase
MKIKKSTLTTSTFLKTLLLAVLILSAALSCNRTAIKLEDSNTTRIILFHLNDIHSQIDNFAKIAWYIEQEKKNQPGAEVFLLNAGDNFSGNPVVDQYNPKGEPLLQLMNRMGFAVMALGNHEFDYGQEVLKQFMQRANFPIICANIHIRDPGSAITQPEPFKILTTRSGIKIAVLGLLQVDKHTGFPDTHPSRLQGIEFADPLETAKKYRYLKKENDILIALTHLGIETDELLAREMSEPDLIIGGHSHSQIHEPIKINDKLIAQAGSNASYLGRIELLFKNSRLINKKGRLINVSSIKSEIPQLREMIDTFNNNPVLNRVIAVLPRPLKGLREVGNLACDAQRKQLNLDIVFQNSGGIRLKHLGPTIALKDIYTLHPFENRVVRFAMTPVEIRSLLEADYERHKRLDLLVSGIRYRIKHTGEGKVIAVELEDENGQPLDETKSYTVGMNDYMASTSTFQHRDPGQSLAVTVNDTLIRYLEQETDPCRRLQGMRIKEITVTDDKEIKK